MEFPVCLWTSMKLKQTEKKKRLTIPPKKTLIVRTLNYTFSDALCYTHQHRNFSLIRMFSKMIDLTLYSIIYTFLFIQIYYGSFFLRSFPFCELIILSSISLEILCTFSPLSGYPKITHTNWTFQSKLNNKKDLITQWIYLPLPILYVIAFMYFICILLLLNSN